MYTRIIFYNGHLITDTSWILPKNNGQRLVNSNNLAGTLILEQKLEGIFEPDGWHEDNSDYCKTAMINLNISEILQSQTLVKMIICKKYDFSTFLPFFFLSDF